MNELSANLPKIKILIVEDNPIAAKEVENILTLLGYSVTGIAASGEAAVKNAAESLPDLVLMDIQLQGEMDGVATAKQIRSFADIPVIFLTASTGMEVINRAVQAEPFGYIVKPVQVPTLRSTIETAVYRHRLESRLRSSEELLATILGSIGDAVIATGTDRSVTFMNPVAETITGWRQVEATGRPFEEVFRIISEKSREPLQSPVERVLATNHSVTMVGKTILISKDGTERFIADSGSPIRDKEGRMIGTVLVFSDISDRVKMEEELLKAQKLESIGILAGGIAHDFNNLLTAILGNISLAKMFTSKEDKIHQKLVEAEKASLRARDLTRQLLTFSRGGAPVKKATSIAELIMESTAFTLSGSRTVCRFDIPENLWPADVDEGQISQVINNLIINADQAMPGGGELEVKCANIELDDDPTFAVSPGRYIQISITDHGEGIEEENLQKIFDPYFTTKEKGKGLGLAMVYSIVRNHGGQLKVESPPGSGATFTVYLPAASTDALKEPDQAHEPPTVHGKILIMDDEEKIREVAGEILELAGYEVEYARDGSEAVEMYKKSWEDERPFAAVIMDLTIPGGMGGKDAIDALRKIDKDIIAIVSSGYSNDKILADYKGYGFSGVISKPYTAAHLTRVLDDVLSRKN